MNKKRCPRCKRLLSIDKFCKCKTSKDGLHWWCTLCRKKYDERYYKSKKGKLVRQKYYQSKKGKAANRKGQLKARYNITPKQYNRMFKKQNECCAVCGKSQLSFKNKLAVDHDHKTGKVRGLLCRRCNLGISYIEGWYKTYSKTVNQYLQK